VARALYRLAQLTLGMGRELGRSGGQVVGVDLSMRARLRAGEPAAFGELFDEHAQAVYRHGYRLTGDRSLAEDVLSATFLQAWRIRGRIDPEGGSLRPWLLGVATNTIRNLNRKAQRERHLLARLSPREHVPDFADELVGRIDDASTLASVRDALRTLRTSEREVIALCVWAGLDYADAAQTLGVPVGTVRSRLSRARRKLARLSTSTESDRNPALAGDRSRMAASMRPDQPRRETDEQ
jgi:RNA polymerase sigma-70 factor (ECF subfamily)